MVVGYNHIYMKAIWKVCGLVAVCHCYPEWGSDCYAKF